MNLPRKGDRWCRKRPGLWKTTVPPLSPWGSLQPVFLSVMETKNLLEERIFWVKRVNNKMLMCDTVWILGWTNQLKKILPRQSKKNKTKLGIRWYQRIMMFMFWRICLYFVEIQRCRDHTMWVLEFALTSLPTRKGDGEGVTIFKGFFSAPPSCKQPVLSKLPPLKHTATLITQAFLKHSRIWATQDAAPSPGLPLGITYSQINHLTFLQHHKIYTFAPA